MNNLALFACTIVVAVATPAFAKGGMVSGYTRSDGTYVAPYVRSAPSPSYSAPSYSAPRAPTFSGSTLFGPDHDVSGYTRPSGAYVAPYKATDPNETKVDNYSARGNVNPYTGVPGMKSPY